MVLIQNFDVNYFKSRVNATKQMLSKIESESKQMGIDEITVFAYRFAPDMWNFREQIGGVVNTIHMLTIFADEPYERFDVDNINNWEGAQHCLNAAMKILDEMDPGAFTDLGKRKVHASFIPEDGMVAGDAMAYAIENLEFHMTTLYDLVRANGFPMSKGDYLGM